MATDDTALRKRQQISKANRTMFIWVACASALVSFACVTSYFLFQKMMYNNKVIGAQSETIKVLKKNIENADSLKKSVRVLNTNEKLMKLRADEADEPAQVIVDALPAVPNSAALGASLQSTRLLGRQNITIESIRVDPTSAESSSTSSSGSSSAANTISFSFQISAKKENEKDLRQVLVDMELSIRAISLTSVKIEQQGSRYVITAKGVAFYQPAKTLDMTEKVIKR